MNFRKSAILTALFLMMVFMVCSCVMSDSVSDSDDDDDDEPGDDDGGSTDDDANIEGVWTDPDSELMWQNTAEVGSDTQLNYYEAEQYCGNLSLGALNGWRMPTISELRSLLRGCTGTMEGGACGVTDECSLIDNCWTDACDGCSDNGGPGTGGAYWSEDLVGSIEASYWSSTRGDIDEYDLLINFESGRINYWPSVEESFGSIRCVRP